LFLNSVDPFSCKNGILKSSSDFKQVQGGHGMVKIPEEINEFVAEYFFP
jgi:hypothetical protein